MARARKLFPIYGSALANHMLAAIERDRVVDRFVAAYVADYKREGILGGPARDRELVETIGREILMAMIVEVNEALPAFFGMKPKSKLKSEEKEAIRRFFPASCWRLWGARKIGNGEDRSQFRRDLGLYSEFSARREVTVKAHKKGKVPEEEAPFVARVALLLDPSMLEQPGARRGNSMAVLESWLGNCFRKTLGLAPI